MPISISLRWRGNCQISPTTDDEPSKACRHEIDVLSAFLDIGSSLYFEPEGLRWRTLHTGTTFPTAPGIDSPRIFRGARGLGAEWRKPTVVLSIAVLRILRAGAPWRDLPPEYGGWKTPTAIDATLMIDAMRADFPIADKRI